MAAAGAAAFDDARSNHARSSATQHKPQHYFVKSTNEHKLNSPSAGNLPEVGVEVHECVENAR